MITSWVSKLSEIWRHSSLNWQLNCDFSGKNVQVLARPPRALEACELEDRLLFSATPVGAEALSLPRLLVLKTPS